MQPSFPRTAGVAVVVQPHSARPQPSEQPKWSVE